MSILDGAIVAAAVALALIAAASARIGTRALAAALAVLLAACVTQVWREGFYWQYAPLYLLLCGLAVLAWRRTRAPPRRWLAWAGRAGVAALGALALLGWTLLPVPELPAPTGAYPVGTRVFRWIDRDRDEPATDDPRDRRNVVVQAWYPAAPGAGARAPYIDGLGRLPSYVSVIPAPAMAHYDRIDTHARLDAPVSRQRPRWPVVLFSPGYGASRSFYSALLADLASRGFVVLALDHPFEAAVTELADGRVVAPLPRWLPDDPDQSRYMSRQQTLRAADLRFVAARVGRDGAFGPDLSARLDPARIAAIGHSFGGASAVAAAMSDARIRAAANIDGTLYGDIVRAPMPVPFLLLESDHRETGHSQHYLRGNLALIGHLRAGGYRYQIARANHFSFTDAPLWLWRPARFALSGLIGGSRGPVETVAASNDVLVEFLRGPLLGEPGDVAAAAARHRDLSGGPQPRRPPAD